MNIIFLTLNKNIRLKEISLMGGVVNITWGVVNKFTPIIKLFNNKEELESFLEKYEYMTIEGITAHALHYYDHNIAHALYDLLYPLYLMILRFYDKDIKFNIFLNIMHVNGWKFPYHASREWNLDIFKRFVKGDFIINNENKNYKFKILMGGSGKVGIASVNSESVMPGGDINALEKI